MGEGYILLSYSTYFKLREIQKTQKWVTFEYDGIRVTCMLSEIMQSLNSNQTDIEMQYMGTLRSTDWVIV